ncbi:oligosaccharide flippase family protein [Cellulosimicrobium sp. PMB13]|uniref:oligosaccharide flippase family protein n=1 Tax=Cellulosimicrobium sp. PMB13 TaxID=3120158 RepID=UPI003F4C5A53
MTAPDVPPPDGTEGPATPTLTRGSLQRLAIRGAYWTLLHTAVSMPLAFAVNIVLARVLGVEDYGRLAYLTSILAIVDSIISMGIGTGVIQFGSKAHAAGRTDEVKNLLSTSQAIRLLVAAPVLTLVVISVVDVSPAMLAVTVMFGVLLPSVFGSALYCFGIENKTAEGAKNAMLVNALTQGLVLVAIFTVQTADAVWAARLVMGGIGVVLALFYVAPAYRRAALVPRFRRFPPGFWRFALPAGLATMTATMLSSRVEVVVLTWMSEPEAAGVYALAFGLATHLFSPAQALVGPLIPAVSGLHEIDRASVGRALSRTVRASSTVMALLLASALPLLAFLVPVIYGEQYAGVPEVLLVLGVSGGLMVIVSPVKAFVMARLSGNRLLVVNLCALVVNVGTMFALVPVLGVWGAVLGNVAAALLQVTMLLVSESRIFGVGGRDVLRAVAPFALGAVAGGGSWYAVSLLGLPSVAAAVVAATLGLVLLVLLLHLVRAGLTPEDSSAITGSLPRTIARIAGPFLRLCTAQRSDAGR